MHPTAGDESVSGTLAVMVRSDGTEQVTYRGRPLYYFAGSAHLPLPKLTTLAIAGALAWGVVSATSLAVYAQDDGPANNIISTVTDDLGTYLVDGAGATLYYFVPDPPGMSVCEGDCLAAWPALTPTEGTPPWRPGCR